MTSINENPLSTQAQSNLRALEFNRGILGVGCQPPRKTFQAAVRPGTDFWYKSTEDPSVLVQQQVIEEERHGCQHCRRNNVYPHHGCPDDGVSVPVKVEKVHSEE
jgi:hypothetical protein